MVAWWARMHTNCSLSLLLSFLINWCSIIRETLRTWYSQYLLEKEGFVNHSELIRHIGQFPGVFLVDFSEDSRQASKPSRWSDQTFFNKWKERNRPMDTIPRVRNYKLQVTIVICFDPRSCIWILSSHSAGFWPSLDWSAPECIHKLYVSTQIRMFFCLDLARSSILTYPFLDFPKYTFCLCTRTSRGKILTSWWWRSMLPSWNRQRGHWLNVLRWYAATASRIIPSRMCICSLRFYCS